MIPWGETDGVFWDVYVGDLQGKHCSLESVELEQKARAFAAKRGMDPASVGFANSVEPAPEELTEGPEERETRPLYASRVCPA